MKVFCRVWPALISVCLLLVIACGGDEEPTQPGGQPTSPGSGSQGDAVFAVSDAAADLGSVSSIQVTIDSVSVHAEGGAWTALSSEAQTFDLVELRSSGAAQLLAEASLDAGTYDQIELNVSQVTVVDAEGEHEASLPSNTLTMEGTLEVVADATATANFDIIADQSLHVTGEGRYVLAPVVQMETRSGAQAEVQSDNVVVISGGEVTTDIELGMNVEGSVDAGLRITPDAMLSIAATGEIIQTRGQALASGTIEAVDTTNGTVTILTEAGSEIVLHFSSDTMVQVDGEARSASELSNNVGAEVTTQYNAQTKGLTRLAAGANSEARAEAAAQLSLTGTVQSVNSADGTVTILTDSGSEVVLQTDSSTVIQLGGSVLSGLLGLQSEVGSRVQTNYDASTNTVAELQAEAEATATATGTIEAVNTTEGTITLATAAGADLTLNVASSSELLVNGSLATLARLSAMVESEATVEYSQETNVITELNARAEAEATTTITGVVKSVNAAEGALTVTTASGEDVVLDVASNASIVANGTISSLVSLAAKVGTQITAEVESGTNQATSISTQAKANASVSGSLEAVNTATNTITIATETAGNVTLNIAADSRVKAEGRVATLATLAGQIGSQVRAEFNAETAIATTVDVRSQASATVTGTLEAVNTAANTITIQGQAGAEVVLNIAADTKILVDASASTVAALAAQVGSQVTAEYNVQTQTATNINAEADASARATVTGTLEAVGLAAGTVTIAAEGAQETVLNVTADTEVLVGGAVSSLVALSTQVGSQVTAEYNSQTNTVTNISAQGQASASATVEGTLAAVDTATGRVTITTEAGADVVLNVVSSTEVQLDGAVTTLATLAANVGSQVTAEYNTQTSTATSISAEAESSASASISGVITDVNAIANSVTISVEGSGEMVLSITSESQIIIDGSAATIAELATHIESQATVQYNVETNTIISITI